MSNQSAQNALQIDGILAYLDGDGLFYDPEWEVDASNTRQITNAAATTLRIRQVATAKSVGSLAFNSASAAADKWCVSLVEINASTVRINSPNGIDSAVEQTYDTRELALAAKPALSAGYIEGPTLLVHAKVAEAFAGGVDRLSTDAGDVVLTSHIGNIPADAPYTITVPLASRYVSTAAIDDGVEELDPVVGAPGEGEYSVLAGVYTFNAASAGRAAQITYNYQPHAVASLEIIDGPIKEVPTPL